MAERAAASGGRRRAGERIDCHVVVAPLAFPLSLLAVPAS